MSRSTPYQQRISLGYPANPAGLKRAEAEARKISALLLTNEFSWEPYLKVSVSTPVTCGEWVDRFHAHYIEQGGREENWQGDYWKIFKRLPENSPMEQGILEATILQTKPNTKTRVRACMAIGAIAKFAAIVYDPTPLRGNYGAGKTARRELPDDRQIAEIFYQISNPGWQWVYGMMACYGLRNHEVFHLDLKEFPIIEVGENTKTGSRQVFPCYPEWADEWGLRNRILPPIDLTRSNEAIGNSVTRYLSPLLAFSPYDLRHSWAVRTLLYGFPVELAASQMGHSVALHVKTYHRWITSQHYRKIYTLLMERADRPIPPLIHSSSSDTALDSSGRKDELIGG